jgi:hypothetical protein
MNLLVTFSLPHSWRGAINASIAEMKSIVATSELLWVRAL